jgi:hypothetical protein
MASYIDLKVNTVRPSNPDGGRVRIWSNTSGDFIITDSAGDDVTLPSGFSTVGDMLSTNNLSELTNLTDARDNLDLGNVAIRDFTTSSAENGSATTVARGDHKHDTRYYTETEVDGLVITETTTVNAIGYVSPKSATAGLRTYDGLLLNQLVQVGAGTPAATEVGKMRLRKDTGTGKWYLEIALLTDAGGPTYAWVTILEQAIAGL